MVSLFWAVSIELVMFVVSFWCQEHERYYKRELNFSHNSWSSKITLLYLVIWAHTARLPNKKSFNVFQNLLIVIFHVSNDTEYLLLPFHRSLQWNLWFMHNSFTMGLYYVLSKTDYCQFCLNKSVYLKLKDNFLQRFPNC